MNTESEHILLDLYDCDPVKLNEVPYVQEAMEKAAEAAGATVLLNWFHQFSPMGVSGVLVISESHFAIHTWPEHGFAAIDLYTCGKLKTSLATDLLIESFGCSDPRALKVIRGAEENVCLTRSELDRK